MTKATVIVPAFNSAETIERCITSVVKNSGKNFELIIVDDCSTDKTLELIKNIKKIYSFTLLRNKKNLGAAASRNRGIRVARGDIILFLDSDSFVNNDWIEAHLKKHREVGAEVIGGGVSGVYNNIFGRADCFCNWWTSVPYGKTRLLKKLHLPSNNLSVKREFLNEIGYFREDLRFGGEDAEFCFRTLKRGGRIFFDPELLVFHQDRSSFSQFLIHQKNWGKHAIKMRRSEKMDFSFLLPFNKTSAYFYILPLASLYTLFILTRWVKHEPEILFYSPLIFLGKIAQVSEIKNSFED